MGLCASQMTPEAAEQIKSEKKASKEIDAQNEQQQVKENQVNKLLLLGAGQSGKSTLFKQVMRIYGNGFSQEDRAQYVTIIYNNVVWSMQELITQTKLRNLDILQANHVSRDFLIGCKNDGEVDSTLAEHVAKLWKDPSIQAVFQKKSEFQLNDNCEYFFENIHKIGAPNYLPDDSDLLRARIRTTGIIEYEFTFDNNKFRMFDVGGQRNERKKWIHCFENVTAVIFVASLSEYDQMLYEDNNTNRLHEALNLFEEVCNSRWFKDTAMILFLNKYDLFQEKIKRVPLKVCLPDYEGNNTVEDALQYIKIEFEARNNIEDKEVYTYVTCAMDQNNVAKVFSAVKDIVIRKSLDEAGLR